MKNYDETKEFWSEVFGEAPAYSPSEKININEIESGLDWLIENNRSVIDFGCGNGKVISRCLDKGIKFAHGIDICKDAVEIAKQILTNYGHKEKLDLLTGGVEQLNLFMHNSVDCAVLFNIIDNIDPKDSMHVLNTINKIIKPGGKILLKINPYIEKEQREQGKFREISKEFYKEESGLFLWNLSDEKFREIIKPYFIIEEEIVVEFKEYDLTNRMYYLRNK